MTEFEFEEAHLKQWSTVGNTGTARSDMVGVVSGEWEDSLY